MRPHRHPPFSIRRLRRPLFSGGLLAALLALLLQGSHPAFAPILLVTQHIGGLQQQNGSDGDSVASREHALLERARTLRLEGAYEEAAATYRAAAQGALPGREAALLGAAESLLAADQYRGALDVATQALQANGAAGDAYVVQAMARQELGDARGALDALRAYGLTGPAGGYGAFLAAEIQAELGEGGDARESYQEALSRGLSTLWQVAAARRLGESYLAGGDAVAAITWLERAATLAAENERRAAPVWFDGELVRRGSEARSAAVLLQLAGAHRRAGASEAAIAVYQDLMASYPASPEAGAALERVSEMDALGRIDPYDRGLVLFHADRPREAIAAFSAFLASGPEPSRAAAAQYFAARAQAETGDRAGAAAQLTAMAHAYPASRHAPDALLRAARLTEATGTGARAAEAYLAVADAYPASEQGADALHRAAWLFLRGGNAAAARESWRRLGEHVNPEARARGLFWLGRGLLGLGDAAGGRSLLQQAAEAAPWSYESLRARDLADAGLGAEPYTQQWTGSVTASIADDTSMCTAWIDTWAASVDAESSASERLARIDRLLSVGMRGPAQGEALDAIAAAGRPRDLYAFARGLESRGLYPVAIYAARQLAAASPAGTLERSPACVQRLAYPLAFADLVQREARAYGLDPYVVLGLLRQESWFSSGARSTADARGLGQVIPSTGRDIARALGRTTFSAEDLYRPQESVAFCAWYLAEQQATLGRRPLLALAAYNAGPGNARRWTAGNLRLDPDDYIEAIDFAETRNYVRTIYQNYMRYRELYG